MSARRLARIVYPVLAAATVGCLFVGASALSSGTPPDPENSTVISSPSAASEQVRKSARDVFEAFAGTPEQQNAGLVLRAHALNGAMDECMAQQGFPEWDWSLARTYAHQEDPFTVTSWFTNPELHRWSDNLLAMESYMVAEEAMNSDELPKGVDEASGRCLDTVKPISDAEADAVTQPQSAMTLREAWNTQMADLALRLGGNPDKLYACLDAAQVPQLDRQITSADTLDMAVAATSPDPDAIPRPGEAPAQASSAWQGFRDTENAVMAAEWKCRSVVYNAHIGDFAQPVADFSASHEAAIAQAQEGWRQIEQAAAELGYHGQIGPLGG